MRMMCPHWKQNAYTRTSRQLTNTSRETNFQCRNFECGHVFSTVTEINRTTSYPSLSNNCAFAFCKRVCQWMNATASQKAVVTNASNKYSQAKASPCMPHQRRQAKTAGMAEGEVTTKVSATVCSWLISDVGMAVVTGGVSLATLLASGPISTALAIALCICAIVGLSVAFGRAGRARSTAKCCCAIVQVHACACPPHSPVCAHYVTPTAASKDGNPCE